MEDKEVGELFEWVIQVRIDEVTDPEIRWIIGRISKLIRKLVEERKARYNMTLGRTLEHFGIDPETFK